MLKKRIFFLICLLSISNAFIENLWGQSPLASVNKTSLRNKVNSYSKSEIEIVSDIFTGPLLAPFATDVEYITILPSSFKGRTQTPVLFQNESRISLTPGIEYIFSKRIGLLLGSWFTVAGKNTRQFSSIYLESIFLF